MTTFSEPSANRNSQLFNRSWAINWEVAIYIAIFLIAVFTRFYMLGERVMSHDESLHTRYSWNLSENGDFQHTPLMHGPILFHVTAFFYTIFGDNDFTARIYAATLSVLLVMFPLLFRRWLGRWGAILASIMFLISPLILYYGRYIRHDTPSILSAMLTIWAIMMYVNGPDNQKRRAHWLYIVAVGMIWNLGSKETAFIYIAIIGVFLAVYFAFRLLQHFLQRPTKALFYIVMLGSFLGGVLALGMYIILDIVQFDLIAPTETSSFNLLQPYDQQTFFLWTVLAIGAIVTVTLSTLFWVYRERVSEVKWLEVVSILLIAIVVCFAFVVFEEISHTEPLSGQPAAPVVPGEGGVAETALGIRWAPMILTWALAIGGFIFLFLTRRKANNEFDEKDKYGRGFWGTLDLFPEFDLIVVIGTLILPWATALIPYLMKATPADHATIANTIPPFLYSIIETYVPRVGTSDQIGSFILHVWAFVPLMLLSIAIGLMWNWKRWLIASGIFHAIFVFFFTTVFTNPAGLATGMVYSLGYWLEQQGVRRGSQPQYYYLLLIMPYYEFLPVIGSVLSMFAGMGTFWKWRKDRHHAEQELSVALILDESEIAEESSDESEPSEAKKSVALDKLMAFQNEARLNEIPFLLFFAWLAILNLIGYSLAGEKMPWLGTHLTAPLIILTAWFFGRIFDKVEAAKFRKHGWALVFVLAFALVGTFRVISPFVMGSRPFAGLNQDQLSMTYSWLSALVVTVGAFYAIWRLQHHLGVAHIQRMFVVAIFSIFALLTFRSAWIASFINYDYPTEFLVYAHAAPGVKWVLEDIEELSLKITDGSDLRVAYDNEVSWPYSWYFRNFQNVVYVGENPTVQNLEDAIVVVVGAANLGKVEPILEDRYIRFDHNRLWWPMQDYFYLNAARVNNVLDISPSNINAAQIRQGMFDIWWSRDYSTYGAATDKTYDVEHWPVSDRMHFYVRKDYAAQIWSYGVGDGSVTNPLDTLEQNLCTANWQDLNALEALQAPNGMTNPLGISIAPNGNIYVAEEFGHRISVFDNQGRYVGTFGAQGALSTEDTIALTRPNSIAVDANGNLYIADTWNFRIQAFTAELQPISTWGQAGTFGFDAPAEPVNGFWGPRDIEVDAQGRVFVSDTGNKRLRVYQVDETGTAQHLFDVGSGGSGLGQLDEPSGLAIHPDGRLFVADTWNRRISVFTTDGVFLTTYRVRGWYTDLGNRPYIALDTEREMLYVTDPDAGRVLVYNTNGDCLGSFGQVAGTTPTLGQFGVAAGIAVDEAGFVYVTDSKLGRVLKFAPFVPIVSVPVEQVPVENLENGEVVIQGEVTAEITEEANQGLSE